MRTAVVKWILLAAVAVFGAALLLAISSPGGDANAGDRSGASANKKRTKVTLIDTRFGSILADRRGYALYLFTRDQRDTRPNGEEKSRCYGACAKAWPVLHKRGRLRAGKGLDRDLIGKTTRRNGDKQVTYNDHPLYYYVGDSKPEQVRCQDVQEFGGRWLVVSADGEPVL